MSGIPGCCHPRRSACSSGGNPPFSEQEPGDSDWDSLPEGRGTMLDIVWEHGLKVKGGFKCKYFRCKMDNALYCIHMRTLDVVWMHCALLIVL
ncbi:hypothetical protein BS78_09G179600 [Paspalum vaginatum]|nr:hypothetical protein BS78_09G179600 [Paspalum vaginatum]